MVGFGDPPNHAAPVRTVLAGDPVGLRTGREDREAVGARRGLVQEARIAALSTARARSAITRGPHHHGALALIPVRKPASSQVDSAASTPTRTRKARFTIVKGVKIGDSGFRTSVI